MGRRPQLISVQDLTDHLKKEGLMIVPEDMVKANWVDGVPLELYRRSILQKPLLTFTEISKARLWGKISKDGVRKKAEALLMADEIIKVGHKNRVPKERVLDVARSLGMY